jgi:tRNA threonylcarbamoyladenosine biosynthesis protein TsaB
MTYNAVQSGSSECLEWTESRTFMLLAIDTATRIVSLALHDGTAILAEETWRTADHHTVELTPALQGLLARVGIEAAGLTALAAALGPGSYTGLRIGLSLAKGLALAASPPLPLIGIPTLDVVAAAQPHTTDTLVAVTQAGRRRINAGFYGWRADGWQAEGDPFITTWGELSERLDGLAQVAGEVDAEGYEILAGRSDRVIIASAALGLRRAGFMAELALRRLQAGAAADAASTAPIYLS